MANSILKCNTRSRLRPARVWGHPCPYRSSQSGQASGHDLPRCSGIAWSNSACRPGLRPEPGCCTSFLNLRRKTLPEPPPASPQTWRSPRPPDRGTDRLLPHASARVPPYFVRIFLQVIPIENLPTLLSGGDSATIFHTPSCPSPRHVTGCALSD
jgi:hypothetical protein